MRTLDATETARLLPYGRVAQEIRTVLLARRDGGIHAPDRTVVPLPNAGRLLTMSVADPVHAVVKVVTVHPLNSQGTMQVIQGEAIAIDSTTGRRLAILDGATVTARRTAALSLLATQSLRRAPTTTALIIGAGAQSRAHLEALVAGAGVRQAYIRSRSVARAERLAMLARGQLGIQARTVSDVTEVLATADVVVTATTSKTPVLYDPVADDAVILGVGSFTPDASEVHPSIVAKTQVVVDSLEGARAEAGDLVLAAEAGAWSWDRATELEQVLREGELRRSGGPVFFKSVGHALFDLAAVRVAVAGLDHGG